MTDIADLQPPISILFDCGLYWVRWREPQWWAELPFRTLLDAWCEAEQRADVTGEDIIDAGIVHD